MFESVWGGLCEVECGRRPAQTGGGGVRRGSGQDLISPLVVQLLLSHSLLMLPLSFSSLLTLKLPLLLHLSPQVGLIRLTALLPPATSSTHSSSVWPHSDVTQMVSVFRMSADVPFFLLLVHQLHLLHQSVQLVSLSGQLQLFLHVHVHCSTHTHTHVRTNIHCLCVNMNSCSCVLLRLCWICRLWASITSFMSRFLASRWRRLCSSRLVHTSFSFSSISRSVSSSSSFCFCSSSDKYCRYACCSACRSAWNTQTHTHTTCLLIDQLIRCRNRLYYIFMFIHQTKIWHFDLNCTNHIKVPLWSFLSLSWSSFVPCSG